MLLGGALWGAAACHSTKTVDYNADVKPILNNKCISCHGGVKKQGGFSLLFEDEAKAKLKSGKYGIIPGDADNSEMIIRLTAHDEEERMPYKEEPLSEQEIKILKDWIDEGAEWGTHWAYKPVEQQVVPELKSSWAKNAIDYFIQQKAEENGLQMSAQAEPEVLARRVALDLIGFPAPDSLKAAYLQNPTEKTYQEYVDKLLNSPHFGEKWTSMWLDLARYADTKGYERDGNRNIWRYRDWLIRAFNKDMPYDEFVTEQLAGDLLPSPSEEQYIATAYHRNSMTNDEGGTDNEEFRVAAVLDRVNTTWETLMGTSFACVQCHSHPYDPFRHEDYYKFMGYFNNSRDNDTYADYPVIRHFDDLQKQQLAELSNSLPKEDKDRIVHFIKTLQPAINSLETDQFTNAELNDTKWLAMRNHGQARMKQVNLTDKNSLVFSFRTGLSTGNWQIHMDSSRGPVLANFRPHPTKGWEIAEIPLKATAGTHDLIFTFQSPELKNPEANGISFDWFHFTKSFPTSGNKQLYTQLLKAEVEQTPIMLDNVPEWSRETRVFERGSWLSLGEEVQPGVPVVLAAYDKDWSADRLGMAKWMFSPKHPLTSRVIVNRIWEQFFGIGIVETLEDFGSQGALPSHPQLLDFLSYQLMNDYQWSLKKLMREIALSATYRQSSVISEEQLQADKFNKWLARGPRIRLNAEQVRDQALMITGVLNPTMYGEPVMPYQPEGVWLSPYNGKKWVQDSSRQQYRRAVYVFWKRTAAYPSLLNFDAVGREVCTSRRINTNTPIQALTTLNDLTYVDMATKWVEKYQGMDEKKAIDMMFKDATGRVPSQGKIQALFTLYQKAEQKQKSKKAALILVANAILNLDEIIMKS